MPIRSILAAAAVLFFAAYPASARQLAVGAAAGFVEPPGYIAVPVFTPPRGPSWTPVDTSMGYPFREPVYATPRGYKYIYVRGYYWKRLPPPYAKRAYRKLAKPVAAKVRRVKVRHGPCVTDIGYGRHEFCPRFY